MPVLRTLAIAALALAAGAAAEPAGAQALEQAAARGTLRLGVRADAPPFSSSVEAGRFEGFSVDLCRVVVEAAAARTGRPIRPDYVVVDAGNRLAMLAEGKIDLLCEATSRTLGRTERVDFSLPIFVTGAGLMIRLAPSPVAVPPLGGGGVGMPAQAPRRIGVLAGTTTEQTLRGLVGRGQLGAQIVEAATHQDGLAALSAGLTDAYSADLEILVALRAQAPDPAALAIADRTLTLETYAIGIRPGARDLHVLADRAVAEQARSGRLLEVAERHFPGRRPGEAFLTMMLLNALPD